MNEIEERKHCRNLYNLTKLNFSDLHFCRVYGFCEDFYLLAFSPGHIWTSGSGDSFWLEQMEFTRHSSKVSGQRSASFPGLYGKQASPVVCCPSFPLIPSFLCPYILKSCIKTSVWLCNMIFFWMSSWTLFSWKYYARSFPQALNIIFFFMISFKVCHPLLVTTSHLHMFKYFHHPPSSYPCVNLLGSYYLVYWTAKNKYV